ncbi:uroporphyrinogen decarboxylase family protein [Sporomusa sp.]|uniref:uroporphyrinogen decarboxylase family protein n=1 Tax=Sporomusa sp. TaxID=2078658 RepID=UPI002BD11410|nr:uroporphyrinogen decarboxylase family protein [Sporomusa sp.]HWR09335.1 uroporphyrinogen decarboxylase family protein [Sporomusa sp.]
MLTPKERALRALALKQPDRVPVGVFLGGSWPVTHSGLTLEGLIGDPATTARVFYEVNKDLDADIIMVGAGATALMIRALGGDVRFTAKGAPAIITGPVATEADLGRMTVTAAGTDPAVNWLFETAAGLSRLAADERLVLASGRAPFTLAAQLAGMDQFLKALHKNKSFAHKLLRFTAELSAWYFTTMLDRGLVHGSFIADPTASGDVISKQHFQEFAFPYLQQVVSRINAAAAGKPVMLHICGNIRDRLDSIAATGINCLSVESKVSIREAQRLIGSRVCIAGNVDPVDVLEFGNQADIRQAVNRCLAEGTGGSGFILLPGCDLGDGVPAENIRLFVDCAHNWVYQHQ